MKKFLFPLIALMLISNFSFAQWNKGRTINGSGDVKTENRKVSGFNKISVSHGVDVYLHQGSNEKVEVKADDNIIPAILTEVKGGVLKVYTNDRLKNYKELRIDVWFKDLESISSSGGSDLYSVGSIRVDELALASSGGSDMELEVEAEKLNCASSGGSDMVLMGSTNMLVVESSGGSDLKAYKLTAKRCKVRTSGGSDAYINATEELDISASGASDVHVKGGAKIVSQKVSGSSDVHY